MAEYYNFYSEKNRQFDSKMNSADNYPGTIIGDKHYDVNLLKLISFMAWVSAYIQLVAHTKKHPEFCNRLVTLLHGSVSTWYGLKCCSAFSCDQAMKESISMVHLLLMLFSWGYFVFDLFWCLCYWPENLFIFAHHLCSVVALTRYMQRGMGGSEYACAVAGLEITNPLFQIRWFLRNLGYHRTKFFMVIDVAFLLLFVCVRGVLGTVMLCVIMRCDNVDLETKTMYGSFYIISIGFLYEMYGYIRYKYGRQMAYVLGKIFPFLPFLRR